MDEVRLDYSDVLLVPQSGGSAGPNSRNDVVLTKPTFGYGQGIPIIAANMDTVGTFEMATALARPGIFTALHKHYSNMEINQFMKENERVIPYLIISIGTADLDKWIDFWPTPFIAKPAAVCIDVANGYTEAVFDFISQFRKRYPEIIIIAGNVCTPQGVYRLITAGADIVKVGIGPGSVCTTRRMTGVGYPQFSAVVECAEAAHSVNGQIVADGGITCPGDIAKALAGGADYVMVGGLFAGHDEGGGETVAFGGNDYKRFYGMASKAAQDKYHGGVAEYRASEGKEVLIPYRGPVKNTVQEITGGLRSACALMGVSKLADIAQRAVFVRVNRQLNEMYSAN